MKKRYLRFVSVVITLMLVSCIGTNLVSADDNSTYVEFPQELTDIINGSDNLIDYFGIYSIQPRWGSSAGRNATHQYITACALATFYNDMPNYVSFAVFNSSNWEIIMSASDLPDIEDIGELFAGHFYDPNTGKNYLGDSTNTARTNFIYWYNAAVDNYSTDEEYAFECLGRALHFIQDASEPHHASNKTALDSNHTAFESYVDQNRTSFGGSTSLSNNTYSTRYGWATWEMVYNAAVFSYPYASTVTATNNESTWSQVADATVTSAIEYCACVIFNFAKDVGINVGIN